MIGTCVCKEEMRSMQKDCFYYVEKGQVAFLLNIYFLYKARINIKI